MVTFIRWRRAATRLAFAAAVAAPLAVGAAAPSFAATDPVSLAVSSTPGQGTVDYNVALTNNNDSGIGSVAIHVMLPPGAQVIESTPAAEIDNGNVLSWFQATGPSGHATLSGYQFSLQGTKIGPLAASVDYFDSTGEHSVAVTGIKSANTQVASMTTAPAPMQSSTTSTPSTNNSAPNSSSSAAPTIATPNGAPVAILAVPTVNADGSVGYGVSVTNNNDSDLGPVSVHVILPNNAQITDASPSPEIVGNTISWYQATGPGGHTTLNGLQFSLAKAPQGPITVQVDYSDSNGNHSVVATSKV